MSLRASRLGAAIAAVLLVGVLLLLTEDELPADARRFVFAGGLLGLVAGGLGNWMVAQGALTRVGDPNASTAFLRSIVLDFGVQALAIFGGTVGLFLLGVKFPGVAAFGLSVAVTALALRAPGTVMVNRALALRTRRRQEAQMQSAASSLPTPTLPPQTLPGQALPSQEPHS